MEPITNITPPSPQDDNQPTIDDQIGSPSFDFPSQSVGINGQLPEIKIKKKHKYAKPLLIVVLCEILIGIGVYAFFWRDNKAIQQQNADTEIIQGLKQDILQLEGDNIELELEGEDDFSDFENDDFSDY